jgi:hypothetical protein
MTEMSSTIDRLEARLDYQAARIDALYALLQERGVLPRPADAGRGDALFDEVLELEDAPLERERRARPSRPSRTRPRTRLHVGTATGV